jgi:protein-S-isoprenylcysteine O-methyltransferase Ste14
MHSELFLAVVFGAVSVGLLALSWNSLRVPHSHGFYRFFAWEAILALILTNSHAWFSDPLSGLQIVSWVLLVLSLVVLGLGLHMIHMAGARDDQRRDSTLFGFEKTTTLVTAGIYGYIRHPLYGSLLFLSWGALLKEVTWFSACLGAVATLCLVATARADEAECVRYFGTAYEVYKARTKMFVPGLF